MKRCTKCGELKPANTTGFEAKKGTLDGMHGHCRECRNAAIRLRRETSPEARAAQAAKCRAYFDRRYGIDDEFTERRRQASRRWRRRAD